MIVDRHPPTMKSKLTPMTLIGRAAMDRRFSSAMLPSLLREIRRNTSREKVRMFSIRDVGLIRLDLPEGCQALGKRTPMTLIGRAAMDRRFSSAMLPSLLREIRRNTSREKTQLGKRTPMTLIGRAAMDRRFFSMLPSLLREIRRNTSREKVRMFSIRDVGLIRLDAQLGKRTPMTLIGRAAMDRRFSSAMLPSLLREIRRNTSREKVRIFSIRKYGRH
ncbi:hypothetical protein JYU34_021972 [Plutella xylostella]|uniref:Uncharacterized protein n=1 Tax=Plutella xylostella TaxID=51655 RepID=A0ABQ7PVL1_PLUXY|nr:hypothetical protein JYU34_021972 [Plutella xylostella]